VGKRSTITEESVFTFLGGKYTNGFSRSITMINGKNEMGKEKDLEIDHFVSDIEEYQSKLPFKIKFDEKTKEFEAVY